MRKLKCTFICMWPTALLFLTSCKQKLPQDALSPHGKYSRITNDLWRTVFPIAVVVFVLVQGLIIYVVIRYRRRSEDDPVKQVHGNSKLELTWTILPALLLVFVAARSIPVLFQLSDRPAAATNPVRVEVIGHQWWWEFSYPKNNSHNTECMDTSQACVRSANELVIPSGRPVDIQLQSKNVIHSFWPPELAGKVDVTSGRKNYMTVQADKPGEFYGQCAEFCGLSHANMRFRVVAMTASDYATWWSNQTGNPVAPITPAAQTGEQLFTSRGCAGCHMINGLSAGTVGPNLTHFDSRHRFAGSIFETNDENLRRWLRNPPAEKPGSQMPNLNLSEEEISNLIAYLDSLK